MEITINENLQPTLDRLASERSTTVEDYIQNYIESHLVSQYRQNLISQISSQALDDLVTIDAALAPVTAAIKEKYVNGIPEVIPDSMKTILEGGV